MGSEKGMPSSITSAPPSCMESRIGTVSSGVGYPAVTKVTSAEVFYRRHWSTEKDEKAVDCCYLCRLLLEYFLNVIHCGRTAKSDDIRKLAPASFIRLSSCSDPRTGIGPGNSQITTARTQTGISNGTFLAVR